MTSSSIFLVHIKYGTKSVEKTSTVHWIFRDVNFQHLRRHTFRVSVRILEKIPRKDTSKHRGNDSSVGSNQKGSKSKGDDCGPRTIQRIIENDDIYSTVFAESADVLVAMQVFDGHLCALCVDGESTHRRCWAPVIVRVLLTRQSTSGDKFRWNDGGESDRFRIFVPPCLASCIGLSTYAPGFLESGVSISPLEVDWNPSDRSVLDLVRVKDEAKMREIGVPPDDLEAYFGWTSYVSNGSDSGKDLMEENQRDC